MSTFFDGSISNVAIQPATRILAGNDNNGGYFSYQELRDTLPFLTQAEIEALPGFGGGGASGGLYDAYVCVADVKGPTIQGGSAPQNLYSVRELNTEIFDESDLCSLALNQITLTPGTYYVRGEFPAYAVNRHHAKLRDIGNGVDLLIGSSEYSYAPGYAITKSRISGEVSVEANSLLEIWHYTQSPCSTYGFGIPSNVAPNRYSVLELWRRV